MVASVPLHHTGREHPHHIGKTSGELPAKQATTCLYFPDFGTFIGQDKYGLFIFELPLGGFDDHGSREMLEVRIGCDDS